MLNDILYFAAEVLVDHGRLAMWMPTANDDDVELAIPRSPYLELSSVCVQTFNKWSRRLLTYVRLPEKITGPVEDREIKTYNYGENADGLNNFRRRVSHIKQEGRGQLLKEAVVF
jgi:tRNA (guanine10-N2)-methyltransferase